MRRKKKKVIELTEDVRLPETGFILEKGDKIEVLKEDYGWSIQRGQEWDAFEDALELFGAEEMAFSLAKAMGTSELGETLAFIFRNNDYDSPYLESSKNKKKKV